MYKILYPKKDATIYEYYPERNAGIDQILELTKYAKGDSVDDVNFLYSQWSSSYNSRILLQFDIDDIPTNVSNLTAYLQLTAVSAQGLPIDYTLKALPLAESWVNGNGYFNDDPETKNGVSWTYLDNETTATNWDLSTYSSSYSSTAGGGSWYTNYTGSLDVSYNEIADVYINVTPIIHAWVSQSLSNHGMIIKHTDAAEQDNNHYGSLKFFSKETHTIYLPSLKVFWSDAVYTGSFSQNSELDDNIIIYAKNIKHIYTTDETVKLRLGVRQKYPTRQYVTASSTFSTYRLPTSSYFSVVDYVTGHEVVPFDSYGTKLRMDDIGHYINLDMNNFLPERYYKILIKVVNSDGTNIYDNKLIFRIAR